MALMQGVSDTHFAPSTDMSRAMMVTILWRMLGEPAASGNGGFDDVASGQWYTTAIAWAAENGIALGVGGNRFDPSGNVTREQLVALLFRYADVRGYDISARTDLSAFADHGNTSDWATEYMRWAVATDLIQGFDGRLHPLSGAIRVESAVILVRFVAAFGLSALN